MRAAKVLSAIDFTESGLRWKFRKPIRRRCSLPCLTRQSLTAKRRLQSLLVQAKVAVCVCSRDELTRPMFVETNLGERRWYSGFSPFTALTFCQAWTGVFFVFGKRQPFMMLSPTSRFSQKQRALPQKQSFCKILLQTQYLKCVNIITKLNLANKNPEKRLCLKKLINRINLNMICTVGG